ncbi:hypothetical protein M5X17_30045 [Paenibacillus alvei]|nr:hypothetical protein [Paenibacillus alvei]MCY9737945.1 hypothetical protein [Paenibacillus alvei]
MKDWRELLPNQPLRKQTKPQYLCGCMAAMRVGAGYMGYTNVSDMN